MPENGRFEHRWNFHLPGCEAPEIGDLEPPRCHHDDGQGFDPGGDKKEDRQGGPGLRMINNRAHLLGGMLTVPPGPGGAGTFVPGVCGPTLDQDRSAQAV